MAHHTLEPNDATLHGFFSRDLPPVLTIDPGDTVSARTMDAGWGLEAPHMDGTERRKLEHPRRQGHALCGPIAIKGAQPGMTLEIQIGEIIPGDYGYTFAGGYQHSIHQALGIADQDEQLLRWTLHKDSMIAENQIGHKVRMKPFMGVLGMPPPDTGNHPTAPPRQWGGNIDCKELTSGTTLYLPIPVEGGLFSVGDGHAAQGDGEVSVTAIECPIDRVDLTFHLHDDLPIQTPRARVGNSWMTFGFHEDLHQAALIALGAMVDLIQAQYGLTRQQALALASPVVDLRVTQIANPTLGVHAVLHDDAIL